MSHPVTGILDAFNGNVPVEDFVAEDAVLEFPYGPSIGVPIRVSGPGAALRHLDVVCGSGLRLTAPHISTLTGDPDTYRIEDTYLIEQVGHYRVGGITVTVPIVSIMTIANGRLTALREYWDTHRLATPSRPAPED